MCLKFNWNEQILLVYVLSLIAFVPQGQNVSFVSLPAYLGVGPDCCADCVGRHACQE